LHLQKFCKNKACWFVADVRVGGRRMHIVKVNYELCTGLRCVGRQACGVTKGGDARAMTHKLIIETTSIEPKPTAPCTHNQCGASARFLDALFPISN
jgi:hypothetical protein